MYSPLLAGSALGTGAISQAVSAYDMARDTPYANSVTPEIMQELGKAADARIKYHANDNQPSAIGIKENVPKGNLRERLNKAFFEGGSEISYASRTEDPNKYRVGYNPNADKVWLAHELGHVVSDRNPVGQAIRSASQNPALSSALRKAAYLAPGAIAAVNPGDDDLAMSILASYAASAPTIADEFLASKNALAIMDTAGMRASMGQRGKLAGGLLTYIATPLVYGATANAVGNLMDDELVGPQPNY